MEEQQDMTEFEQAKHDEQIAIKILGGFGVRNHLGDVTYALKVNALLTELVALNAQDVECILFVAKVRKVEDMEDAGKDRYNLVGGIMGSELELTALHAFAAARIQAFRATLEEKLNLNNGENNGN